MLLIKSTNNKPIKPKFSMILLEILSTQLYKAIMAQYLPMVKLAVVKLSP